MQVQLVPPSTGDAVWQFQVSEAPTSQLFRPAQHSPPSTPSDHSAARPAARLPWFDTVRIHCTLCPKSLQPSLWMCCTPYRVAHTLACGTRASRAQQCHDPVQALAAEGPMAMRWGPYTWGGPSRLSPGFHGGTPQTPGLAALEWRVYSLTSSAASLGVWGFTPMKETQPPTTITTWSLVALHNSDAANRAPGSFPVDAPPVRAVAARPNPKSKSARLARASPAQHAFASEIRAASRKTSGEMEERHNKAPELGQCSSCPRSDLDFLLRTPPLLSN